MARRPRGAVVNRRHLARLERENIQNRYIVITSAVIVVLVVVMVVFGVVYDKFIVARQPVADVNGDKISTSEFQARVRYERNNLVNQYYNTANMAQSFGTDAQFVAYFQNSLNQIELQLDVETLGRDVLNTLIEDKIIRQKAAEMGITVTDADIDKALEENFGFYGGEQPPTPTEVPTTRPTSTYTVLQLTASAPTATPVLTATATLTATEETPTATPEATPTISATATASDAATATATTAPPTATPYTQDAYNTDYQDAIDQLKTNINFTEEDLRYLVASQLYREKIRDALTADLSPERDEVWARHILVADETTAQEVLARLNAGEDFAALAAEYSTDSANSQSGGDLGWFGTGQMDPEFEKVAFNTPIGSISAPVQTTFGWHIIQVLGHEMRPLSADDFAQLRQDKFTEWLSQQRQQMDAQITIYDSWASRTPSTPTVQHIDLQSALAPVTLPTETPVP
ncbi:MAG: peptidylprolyl isomerase [Anaerolineales bacterium]|nr:peptidylprolyl isomerase [Anaerolineales bacterium]